MTEDVVALCFSPNNKFLAAALLDCTVKVFFTDTLKFYISLYGHKLPVTSIDVSSDNSLVITASADKNIKIWGLDFGDCHRSLFAHDESVMKVKFIPDTHMFFSVSRDSKLKCWDADKFRHVQTLEGHSKEVWCVDVTRNGEFVVTSSHDKSIRLWERTDEPLILDDEQETARELEFEKALVETKTTIAGERDLGEVESAGKKKIENIKAAERIMEAIEIYREEKTKDYQYQEELKTAKTQDIPKPEPNVILVTLNQTPSEYVLNVLRKVRSSELDESLLVLPFHYVIDLLKLLDLWLAARLSVELCCRCTFYLLRVHHNQIVSNRVLTDVIKSLNHNTAEAVKEIRDTIGFNLAALKFLKLDYDDTSQAFFADHSDRIKSIKKKKRAVLKTVST